MQLTRCPVCHSRIGLEQLIQDEAGRELLALVARLPDWLAAPLVSYLGLFRPATRDLANDRALRLGREALELHADHGILAQALVETVQAMRAKQDKGQFKPLANHAYLGSVLESVASAGAQCAPYNGASTAVVPASKGPQSKTAASMMALREE